MKSRRMQHLQKTLIRAGIAACGVAFLSGCETATVHQIKMPEPVVLQCVATTEAPVIDGRLDEPMWQQAAVTDRLYSLRRHPDLPVPVQDTGKLQVRTSFDNNHLYVAIQVADADVLAQRPAARALGVPAHPAGDVVEIWLMPVGARGVVYELRVNPFNQQWDARYLDHRLSTSRSTPSTWNSGMKAAVSIQGSVDDSAQADTGWTIELSIPLVSLNAPGAISVGTAPGRQWYYNVTHYDYRADTDREPERLSLAPITAVTREETQIYPIIQFN